MFIFVLMYGNIATCLWYYIGIKTMDNGSWISNILSDDTDTLEEIPIFTLYSNSCNYIIIMYFFQYFVTNSNATPGNLAEQWTIYIYSLINTLLISSYFFAMITFLLFKGDEIQQTRKELINQAKVFCNNKKLPQEITREIL
eukprot:397109_1